MADNRIYLRCNACGETLFLGKSFSMGYYWENYAKENGNPNAPSLEERLNQFYDEHTYCGEGHSDGDYSIVYESPLYDDKDKFIRAEDIPLVCDPNQDHDVTQYTPSQIRAMIEDCDTVKHGHWVKLGEEDYNCSRCGAHWETDEATIKSFKYCSWCGAKMESINTPTNTVYRIIPNK